MPVKPSLSREQPFVGSGNNLFVVDEDGQLWVLTVHHTISRDTGALREDAPSKWYWRQVSYQTEEERFPKKAAAAPPTGGVYR
jgi:hypothetical protein